MAWTLVQAGTKLYALATDGTATELTLPANVTLDVTRKLRAAILNRQVIVVNSPTVNLSVSADGVVRSLVPLAPAIPPTLAAGGSTGLTGTYLVAYCNAIKDRYGNIIAQSPMSPSASITVTNQSIAVSNLVPSLDAAVNCRLVVRTTTGGVTFFRWVDLDDNSITGVDNGLSDAGLSLFPEVSTSLGLPPGSAGGTRLRLCVQWKGALWGVSDAPGDVDNLRRTVVQEPWAWPADRFFPISPVGMTTEGITALIPRRNDLGVCKRAAVRKVVGENEEEWQPMNVIEGSGAVAPDSVAVIHDIGYVLGEDGVYRYDDNGFELISRDDVHAWFTTDTYFNRAWFPYAVGRWNPVLDAYELHLAAAGSTVLDRWVSYDLRNKKWYGPHKTAAFTPTDAACVQNATGSIIPLVGGNDGFVYTMNNSTRTDGASGAIDFDARFILPADTPDIEKVFLQPDILTKIESGGTLDFVATVGGLDAAASAAQSVDLTLGRQRLDYLGPGRILQVKLQQATAGRDVLLFGCEIPYFELGRL